MYLYSMFFNSVYTGERFQLQYKPAEFVDSTLAEIEM